MVVEKEIRIEAPVEAVYAFWQDVPRFAELLASVQSIEPLGPNRQRWVVRAPFNTTVEFEAETMEQRPNEYIRWASLHGAGPDVVRSGGELFFEPSEDHAATYVRLRFQYELPSAAAVRVAETLRALGYPARDFDENLAEIKRRIEQGSVEEPRNR